MIVIIGTGIYVKSYDLLSERVLRPTFFREFAKILPKGKATPEMKRGQQIGSNSFFLHTFVKVKSPN